MEYVTELHCHSGEVSNCASATAQQIVDSYCAAGYTTVVLTNHFSRHTFGYSSLQKFKGDPENHDDRVDFFLSGVEALKEAADGKLNILLGAEVKLNTDDNDYLVYGIDEYFLRFHENIMEMRVASLYHEIEAIGGLLIQPHPFRNSVRITKPENLHGIEVFNGSVGHDSRNDVALLWANKYGMRMTSGSDLHHVDRNKPNGGIVTDFPITSEEQLVQVLRSNNYKLLHAGEYPKND